MGFSMFISKKAFSLFTMCNDFRFNSLLTLLESNRVNGNRTFKVIPFDEDISLVKGLCKAYGAELIELNPQWDELGKSVYGEEYYRPKVSAWRYFRKFNVFNSEDENFLFLDSNVVLFESLDELDSLFTECDIAFANRSANGRNFTESAKLLIDKINPYILEGFNAGFWLANSNFMKELSSTKLSSSSTRSLLTLSPEQSFLSLYACMTDKNVKLIRDLDRSFVAMASAEISTKAETGRKNLGHKKVLSMKWSGKYYHNDQNLPSAEMLVPFVESSISFLKSEEDINPEVIKAANSYAKELGL